MFVLLKKITFLYKKMFVLLKKCYDKKTIFLIKIFIVKKSMLCLNNVCSIKKNDFFC